LEGDLRTFEAEVDSKLSSYKINDPIRDKIDCLFESRVGLPYETDRLQAYYEKAKLRYSLKIPPGFEDVKKEGNNKYGDYIGWEQMLDYAKTQGRPIIFVTKDQRPDWWRSESGETIGPHPELVREMKTVGTVDYYSYSSKTFVEHAANYLQTQISPDSYEDIERSDRDDNTYLNALKAMEGDSFRTNSKVIQGDSLQLALDEMQSNSLLRAMKAAEGNSLLRALEAMDNNPLRRALEAMDTNSLLRALQEVENNPLLLKLAFMDDTAWNRIKELINERNNVEGDNRTHSGKIAKKSDQATDKP
jgi:hypothetical protein